MTDPIRLDINAILKQLPHRYPFLLVDRVVECEKGKHIRALKNVTYNEPFFTGRTPEGSRRTQDTFTAGLVWWFGNKPGTW